MLTDDPLVLIVVFIKLGQMCTSFILLHVLRFYIDVVNFNFIWLLLVCDKLPFVGKLQIVQGSQIPGLLYNQSPFIYKVVILVS